MSARIRKSPSALGTRRPRRPCRASSQNSDARARCSNALTIGRAAVRLGGDHPRALADRSAHRLHLLECLPHADQADASARGIDDHVGQFPPNCSHSSYPIVFLPSMRYGSLSVDTSNQPCCVRVLGDEPAAIGDQAVDEAHVRAECACIRACWRRGVSAGMAMTHRRPALCRVRCRRPAGVAGGWKGHRRRCPSARAMLTAAESPRALNEPVGFCPSSLMKSFSRPQSRPEAARVHERRHAFTERHRACRGQHFLVAPHRTGPRLRALSSVSVCRAWRGRTGRGAGSHRPRRDSAAGSSR